MSFLDEFSHAFVLNLSERLDRRREMEEELARVGVPKSYWYGGGHDKNISFFPAIRPDDWEGWPSQGAKGCFLSHLEMLKAARKMGCPSVLIIEDDLAFDYVPELGQEFLDADWSMCYLVFGLGQVGSARPMQTPGPPMGFGYEVGPMVTTACYAVRWHVLAPLIGYLEECLNRPPGHPDGGPMHVDGAYNMFRAKHPYFLTLVANPSIGHQRSSRSDVTPNWKDRIPGFNLLRKMVKA